MAQWPYSTQAWQRLRAAKLADQPTCEPCAMRGRVVAASVVDHRVSIAAGGDPFPSLDGLMSMCPSCHGVKTAARDAPHIRAKGDGVAFKGCSLDGVPIDPSHPFMGGGGGIDTASTSIRIGPSPTKRVSFKNGT